ncbi:MAG: hypothetical protein DPW09_26895 [Anaerolineae bacterium]|nr:hypothetical protein [Anaerolineae bacterium]
MAIDQTQKAEAIDYLLRQISIEALGQVNAHRDDPTWFGDQHFGLGLWVRNSLRRGDFKWDDLTLDAEWPALIVAMAERLAVG